MSQPEVIVSITRYAVSVLPADDINRKVFTLFVEHKPNGWVVTDGHAFYAEDGTWQPAQWAAHHWSDYDDALDFAREVAPEMTVNGRTATEVWQRTQDPAPEATTAPLAASQPSEAPVEGETGERAATGRVGDSGGTADEGPGWCTFGEDDAPGSGCILPAGHQPPNRHLVTPGDTDDD